MIPALPARPTSAAPVYQEFLTELRLRGFEGDIASDVADRTVFATDNSIYQVAPQAIVFPRNGTDVERIAKLAHDPRFAAVTLTPRGGGTGTNGQSLTDGIVVDLSRHMNRIVSINPRERWAWVEAGVVKDQLNDAVREHGLFFAPELSPSNRATIGGMIATDASGQGSVLYGKTRDHVLELDCVLLDGTRWQSRPLAPEELDAAKDREDRVGAVHRLLEQTSNDHAELIAQRYPRLNRCVTGYDLVHLRDAQGRFDLNSVICGAEGTLAFVTAAKVNLMPLPRHTALVAIRYGSFDAALRDARTLMQAAAASTETVDATVLALARKDAVWLQVERYFPDDAAGPAQAANLVEFLGEHQQELDAKIAGVEALLATGQGTSLRRGYAIARERAAISAIWSMRKKAVGLLGSMPGDKRPVPFVEDTVVPPEHLADYIAEFRAALDRRGLVYGMFGHVDAGCVHVRPALDMKDPAQERMVREISDEVFALTRRYKGVLWGEHGKGVRSEYAPEFFGPVYPLLQDIKKAFDPANQLNPGKIAAPPGQSLLRIDAVQTRGQLDRTIPIRMRAANEDSLHCNGNGACYNYDHDDAMCPSWKATRDRKHSPKGRASLTREWLRRLAAEGVDPAREAQRTRGPSRWLRLPQRAVNAWFGRERDDFSHAVKEAMDGCLACKSCTGQCPIKVDVPSFRARFLEVYHGRYLRPARDLLVASLESMLPRLARAPRLTNIVVASRFGRLLMARIGLVDLPVLSAVSAPRMLMERGIGTATVEAMRRLSDAERRKSVVLVADAFTSYYEPTVVVDFCELLRQLGFTVWVAPFEPNGKPQHVLGLLGQFERTAAHNAAMLRRLAATGVDLVGLDPSITLTYRSEYAAALGNDRAPRVELPQEWLARRIEELPSLRPSESPPWRLLPHCTERTNAPAALRDWTTVFARFGMELAVVPSGCCGMAGLYGHQAEHRATSEQIYRLSWAAHFRNRQHAERVIATGYSCRSQAARIDGIEVRHPLQVLLQRWAAAAATETSRSSSPA